MKIEYGKHHIDKLDTLSVLNALKSKYLTQGPLIKKFEEKICKTVKAKYAVAVSSCSAGLHLAIASLDKNEKKTKIITSPISFVSTTNAVIHNNYEPIFLDIDKNTLNLDAKVVKKFIKKKKNIKAIIPVHLGGSAAKSEELYKISKKKKILLIEDAAHSFGAKYEDGSMVGSCKFSDITVFSFHPVKTITTGEGGIITTNSKKIYLKLLKLRSHGIEKNYKYWKNKKLGFTKKKKNIWYYEMQDLGFNYRITDFQCALGLSQLRKLKKIVKKRKEIANFYDKSFKNEKNIFIPQYNLRNLSSNHLYIINIDFKNINLTRNDFMLELKKKNINSQVHYIPIHFHPFFKKKIIGKFNLPNAINYYNKALSIPIFYKLNKKYQNKIIQLIKKILSKNV